MSHTEYEIDGYTVYEIPYALPHQEQVLTDVNRLVKYFRGDAKTKHDVEKQFYKPGIDISKPPSRPKKSFGPGIQVYLNFSCAPALSEVQSRLSNKVLDFNNTLHERKGTQVFGNTWAFISTPQNEDSNYHVHTQFSSLEDTVISTWTWTYYLEIPDNLHGNEGKLFFSMNQNDSKALKILPKKNHLYIFSAEIPHRPAINPGSSNNRTVLAGNVSIPTDNFKKTLI